MEKKKRIFYNLIVGIVGKILLMVLGFIVPRLYIVNYGSEMNGLLSSIAQVFSYLSLLEAGVGTAATQALYEPVVNNDIVKINGIMSAASRFYKRTGILYGVGVILFALIYPLVVKSSIGNTTVVLLIVLSGANGVLNYLFQAKYFALLNAEGKGYIHVAIGTGVSIVSTLCKIFLLYFRFDVVLVYFVFFILALLQNILISIYIRKNYINLNCNTQPDTDSLKQNNSVLVHQVSSLIFSNTDVLILTFFCNLTTVSVYTIYNMVVTSIASILSIVFGSFTAALGQTFHESKERFTCYYDAFELGTWVLSFGILVVTYLLYNPFIEIYTANADITYVDRWLPVLFVSCQVLSFIRIPGVYAVNVAGHFKATQSRTIIESTINIVLSLIAVQFLGIYGVLIGTIGALLYRTTDFIIYTNRKITYRNPWHIIKRLVLNIATCLVMIIVSRSVAPEINTIRGFIVYGVIYTCCIFAMLIIVNVLSERKEPSIGLLTTTLKNSAHKFRKGK